ncbi:hypothetical protein L1887_57120 [Cichorium endivia]|nr:hypothetical protein L1887_57120 [Cichorium endivia]
MASIEPVTHRTIRDLLAPVAAAVRTRARALRIDEIARVGRVRLGPLCALVRRGRIANAVGRAHRRVEQHTGHAARHFGQARHVLARKEVLAVRVRRQRGNAPRRLVAARTACRLVRSACALAARARAIERRQRLHPCARRAPALAVARTCSAAARLASFLDGAFEAHAVLDHMQLGEGDALADAHHARQLLAVRIGQDAHPVPRARLGQDGHRAAKALQEDARPVLAQDGGQQIEVAQDLEVHREVELEDALRGREDEAAAPALALAVRGGAAGRALGAKVEEMHVRVDLADDGVVDVEERMQVLQRDVDAQTAVLEAMAPVPRHDLARALALLHEAHRVHDARHRRRREQGAPDDAVGRRHVVEQLDGRVSVGGDDRDAEHLARALVRLLERHAAAREEARLLGPLHRVEARARRPCAPGPHGEGLLACGDAVGERRDEHAAQLVVGAGAGERGDEAAGRGARDDLGEQIGIEQRAHDADVVVAEAGAARETESAAAEILADGAVEAALGVERDLVGLLNVLERGLDLGEVAFDKVLGAKVGLGVEAEVFGAGKVVAQAEIEHAEQILGVVLVAEVLERRLYLFHEDPVVEAAAVFGLPPFVAEEVVLGESGLLPLRVDELTDEDVEQELEADDDEDEDEKRPAQRVEHEALAHARVDDAALLLLGLARDLLVYGGKVGGGGDPAYLARIGGARSGRLCHGRRLGLRQGSGGSWRGDVVCGGGRLWRLSVAKDIPAGGAGDLGRGRWLVLLLAEVLRESLAESLDVLGLDIVCGEEWVEILLVRAAWKEGGREDVA